MNFNINTYQFYERPDFNTPSPIFLDFMKEEGIRSMVSQHYDLLSKSSIKHLFPQSEEGLKLAKEHSADFFIQVSGGTPYFNMNRGTPMLAVRHDPFKITLSARIVWLECYREVLQKLNLPEEVAQTFWDYINPFSIRMVNTEE